MPINYVQFQNEIKKIGKNAPLQHQKHQELLEKVLQAFHLAGENPQPYQDRFAAALNFHADLRAAAPPEAEPISAAVSPVPDPTSFTVWAADGSQVIPNRHLAVQFGLINVGLIRFSGSETPHQEVDTRVLFDKDLINAQGYPIGEEMIALRRDHRERELLLNKALQEDGLVITLTDGPLELFREPKENSEYKEKIANYQDVLFQMAEKDVLTAGYVDKPRGDLLVRLLEFGEFTQKDLKDKVGKDRPFIGITDAEIFGEVLKPGQRSAVFRVQSPSTEKYFRNELAIFFFYLNVARRGAPQMARVEIPRWVAENSSHLNLLHHYLWQECQSMGERTYPYILHRSHEVAVVTFKERERLEQMIQQELLNQGLDLTEKSNKQYAKDHPKARYGR